MLSINIICKELHPYMEILVGNFWINVDVKTDRKNPSAKIPFDSLARKSFLSCRARFEGSIPFTKITILFF